MPAPSVSLRFIFAISIGWLIPFCIVQAVYAAEWTMTPSLQLGYEQNDNILMTLVPHSTVEGTTVAPKLEAGVQSDLWRVTGTALVARKNYSGEQGLDRDDQTFQLSSQYTGERNTFSIDASRIRDAVISGQLLDPDVGIVSVPKRRNTTNVNPAWTWSMTERTQIRMEYQLSEVAYVDGQSIGLYDYQSRTAAVTLTYFSSQQDQLFLMASYSTFHAPSLNVQAQVPTQNLGVISAVESVDSKTPTLRFGASHVFSETLSGTLTVGANRTDTEKVIQPCVPTLFGYDCIFLAPGPYLNPSVSQLTHDTGSTYSGNLKKQFEKMSLDLSISHDLAATGAGTQVKADSISLRLERPVTSRLKGVLQADNYQARALVDTNASVNRRQYSLRPSVFWQWTRECNLNLGYAYVHLKRETETKAVQAHAVSATLTYAWPKLSVSR